ncbi:MAG: protein-S-isoprenylcysteine O-methyltransferase, partial [Pseudomonadota bacterium]
SLAIGLVCAAVGLWLFWRSHADLGRNWSPQLELRQTHRLISSGIYARIRHPMYAAIFALTAAQTLLPNNWIAGPAGLVTFTVLYVIRIGPEEDMMRDRFGAEWVAYAAGTRRLFPFPKPRSSE